VGGRRSAPRADRHQGWGDVSELPELRARHGLDISPRVSLWNAAQHSRAAVARLRGRCSTERLTKGIKWPSDPYGSERGTSSPPCSRSRSWPFAFSGTRARRHRVLLPRVPSPRTYSLGSSVWTLGRSAGSPEPGLLIRSATSGAVAMLSPKICSVGTDVCVLCYDEGTRSSNFPVGPTKFVFLRLMLDKRHSAEALHRFGPGFTPTSADA
jgi:hypothetical protein